MKIKLYHGTSTGNVELIQKAGFMKGGYLTSDADQANYYAECAAEEDGTRAAVIIAELDTNGLKADLPSFEEPLTFILDRHDFSEKEWQRQIDKDIIPLPEADDWRTSMEYVFSVRHPEQIPVDQLDLSGDKLLSFEDNIDIEKAIQSSPDGEKPDSSHQSRGFNL